ncbi:hypothetical protein [Methylobacter sp.]|uniref:hypothetical protein n=1 Tax=Methylobacter sp. TaxID=2051955 RepID=UPI00121F0986|nr:hypothetical protein [Methylobacter sp.]TAK61926.1 MAG: hypothetical protein EPO18_12105 [Methylobacter sp.]
MKIVKELPKLTKIEIVLNDDGHHVIKDVSNGDTLDKSFDTIKDAVAYAVGSFLIPVNSK